MIHQSKQIQQCCDIRDDIDNIIIPGLTSDNSTTYPTYKIQIQNVYLLLPNIDIKILRF